MRTFENPYFRRIAWAAILLRLWFGCGQPMVAIGGAGHDDRLFYLLADHIQRGEWLGPYSQFTLMKGPGYPLLIAGAFRVGLPVPLVEQALYLLACWLVVAALRPVLRKDGWALALLALLAWQPMSYAAGSAAFGNTSVVRQNLYTPLTLLIFAGSAALYTRRQAKPAIRAGWALLLGASFGWFWLTREESAWIEPSIALLVLVALWRGWRERLGWGKIMWPCGIAALSAAAPVLTVCTLNARQYGWFGTVEFRAPQFVAAYGSLLRVRAGEPIFWVPVTKAAREKIYEVSPAFAELRPFLEGDLGKRWAGTGWNGETNGAMWMWELRDAVAAAGHATSAPAALAFYQRLADEVNGACDIGKLESVRRRKDTFLPPFEYANRYHLVHDLPGFARQYFQFRDFSARPAHTGGDAKLLEVFRDLGGWPMSHSDEAPELTLPRSTASRQWRIGALQDIGTVLCHVCRWLVPFGALAWVVSAAVSLWRRTAPSYLWWFAAACLGGTLAVFTIALLVHVTSWFDMRPLRFAEAYPLLLLFAGIGLLDALHALLPAKPVARTVPAEPASLPA